MQTDQKNKQYAESLAKYLSGEMSEVEMRAFEKAISVSDQELKSVEEMKKQWSAMKGYSESNVPDASKAWRNLHSRLENEKLIPTKKTRSVRNRKPFFYKVAAIFIVLLGLGAVLYFNVFHKPAGDMVHVDTGNESNTLVKTLNDGSVIYIAQNSLFSFPKEFDEKSRNVGLKGEAFFDITPDPSQPFIIETDEAYIQVLGTAFNVKTSNGNGFELMVDRGKVKVTLKKDPSHYELVMAGEKITSVKNSLVKSKPDTNEALPWYKLRMHFKDESLQNIINVLNRNFNTTFVVAEKETGNRKLTVTFENETPGTMTELMCVTLNLKSQLINGSVVLYENKEDAK